ncbi:two-component system response regulator [Leptolyngbya iicbica]|uniref:EAL domain-containing protein n=2 Tax=Cyanophyceae TaxID=3028117 RepID=A0A4Q7E4I5_9CYAN|nr:EAL domain-containing protein [Leptolyngbya sp. LK]RZM76624.1 EAL domain-containing protein [Leptolyngbya sp. LK]
MQSISILVIDDDPTNLEVVETILMAHEGRWNSDLSYQLHYASSGPMGIDQLATCNPHLVLLDVMMPGMDGIEVCQRIKAMPQWQTVPIIMATALNQKQDMARCLAAGADDFISKPLNGIELSARIQTMLRIYEQQRRLANFNAQLEAKVQDRTAELRRMIVQDTLTGLPNRAGLLENLQAQLAAGETALALVQLDLDDFQLVNDSLGYDVGNQFLLAIAERLKAHLQPQDQLARVGEDEFCWLRLGVTTQAEMDSLVARLLNCFQQPFMVGELEIYASVCVGTVLGEDSDQAAEAFLQASDTATYHAKKHGRGGVQRFERVMHQASLNRLTLENDLQRALERQEFVTYYQPIVDLQTQQFAGFEALVRWQHPERGMVSPGEFIPCMEATGLIVPVGMVVLQQACEQLHRWHQQGHAHWTMSVNLSVRQFACPTLVQDIDRIVALTGVNPAYLKLEITESAIMDNAEAAIAITQELRSRGIQISIDDFGTGYSSLGYLHRFPVDALKIDRSFVVAMEVNGSDYPVVDTILALSHQLKIAVIAEGIETQQQLELLQGRDCQYGQGYLFSRPLSAADLETLLKATVNSG